jgi:hypothetical protein
LKNFLIILFALSTALSGSNLKEITSISEDGEFGEIADFETLELGNSAIVIRDIAEDYKSIISYAILEDGGKVKFLPFETLEQENLPKGKWKPAVGDKIRFGENYNRAFVIAKNYEDFIETEKSFKKVWIHPDLFTATLSTIGHQSPQKEDFSYFCKEHSIGLIYFALNDEVKEVDCLSMTQLKSHKKSFKEGDIQKPFYSRIEDIDTNWIGEGINPIPDFETYYRDLIRNGVN